MKLLQFVTNGRSVFIFDVDVEKTAYATVAPCGMREEEWVEINPTGLWAPGWKRMRNIGTRLDRNGGGPFILVSETLQDGSQELRDVLAKIPESPGLWLERICQDDAEWLKGHRTLEATKEEA